MKQAVCECDITTFPPHDALSLFTNIKCVLWFLSTGDESGFLHRWDIRLAIDTPHRTSSHLSNLPSASFTPAHASEATFSPAVLLPHGGWQPACLTGHAYKRLQWEGQETGPVLSLSAAAVSGMKRGSERAGSVAVVVGTDGGGLSLLVSGL